MVSRPVKLQLAMDPFGSAPLENGATAGGASAGALPGSGTGLFNSEPAAPVGDMSLQAIFVSFGQRVAVVNGKTLREGEITTMGANNSNIRAKRIGTDFVIIEAGTGEVMLRLADPLDTKKPEEAGPAIAARPGDRRQQGGRGMASVQTEAR